jgi:hypothetical protein
MEAAFSLASRIGRFIQIAVGNILSVEEQWTYLAGVR